MSTKALKQTENEALERLQDNLEIDAASGEAAGMDPSLTIRLISEYLKIYEMLEECYDQTIQTQRRLSLRDLLLKTVTRLLELIWNLESWEGNDWSKIAETIMSQAQSIELEIPIPRIVKDDEGPAYSTREDLITKFKKQFEEARIAQEMTKPPPMPLEEAALIVQRAERARHARHETLMKLGVQKQQDQMSRQAKLSDREKSANIIKQFMRKYGLRRKEEEMREKEEVLIGMKADEIPPDAREKVERTIKRRKEEERKRKQELEAAEVVTKASLEDNKAVDLRRKLDELCAEFYNETKMNTGKAPNIKAKINVTKMLLEKAQWLPEPELEEYYKKLEEKKPKKKDEAAAKAEKPAASMGGKKKEVIVVPEDVQDLQETVSSFKALWDKDDNINNITDDFDVELVRKEMWTSMLPDIATSIENKLKRELKNLKVLEMRRVKKAKAPREKKKKQKRVKDPLKMSDEEILAQLVGLGIACNNPSTTFADFVGRYDFCTPVDYEDPNPEKGPSYGSIRSQMIIESVLPFACQRETLQGVPKGVLVCGNKGTGKTTLALAAINALGATFLNFSPEVLLGKETPSPKILVLMLIKAAKTLAPSVILIDDIDRMFGSRKRSDASKKFKAQLRRNVRKLKPRDRVLLIGTTSFPTLPKACTSLFTKCVFVPKPNFSTRVMLWNHWLEKKNLLLPSISVNALSFASKGYTAASIARCCTKAEGIRISRTEPNDPITDAEIVMILADAPEDESKPQQVFNFPINVPQPYPTKK
ncbi:Dynein regulatory complex protein 11 [Tritrichomonas musculus]|uniref:Dynein regulatory complex protein 11 n=1 Tax=Tritrichomonas musculus TaxID=1915356 RepID=A0ABR2JV80_9EUKA